jgi:hypothetical protein
MRGILTRFAASVLLTGCTAIAHGQQTQREPQIGYVYPAGGQRGSEFEVLVGGQSLRGANKVYVSGEGVHASVVRHIGPIRQLNREQMQELMKRLREMREGKRTTLVDREQPSASAGNRRAQAATAPGEPGKPAENRRNPEELPDHPTLSNLAKLTPAELGYVVKKLFDRDKRQVNQQIGESVLIEVTIDPGAAPGDRELRIATAGGLTNPLRFQVGLMPEVLEHEPNNPDWADTPRVELPAVLNGQILPGDIDRFLFRAKRGQKLVIDTRARHLIPYLADAVPGWFQATVALYDGRGKEVAFADDYRFSPDPVLFYEIPADGDYRLEIRDSIYRGREDFVYRIAVGEQPFITGMYPLGVKAGADATAWVTGWNLPWNRVKLDTRPDPLGFRQSAFRRNEWITNAVTYAVSGQAESDEAEPNDEPARAPLLSLPQIVNGFIAKPGDRDVFRFRGRAGDTVVTEVTARRLGSPLDSLLRLTDESGTVLATNDDHEDKAEGLLTHHADSYLTATLPADGVYCVQVSDTQNHGGPTYGYRLRVSPPQPGFALRVTPSSVNVPPTRTVPLTVFALRQDGFTGDIEVAPKDMPAGFSLSGAVIPAGRDRVRMTLTVRGPVTRPVPLKLEGRAQIGGQAITRPAVPADDLMQAFIYRHLVPAEELLVGVREIRRDAPAMQLADNRPAQIPAGGTAKVNVLVPPGPMMRQVQFQLDEPPEGIKLQGVSHGPSGMTITLKADSKTAKPGPLDNLIVDAYMMMEGGRPGAPAAPPAKPAQPGSSAAGTTATVEGNQAKQKRRVNLGVLPAIPFQVVKQ